VRAFGGDDPIVTAGKVSSEPPPPLDGAMGSSLVVRSLGAALSKGVAKELGDRFASCVDLGEAVARAIDRPSDGGSSTSLDALLEAASAPNLDGNGPASDLIEVERAPLSSRVVLERAVRRTSDRPMLTPYGETPSRPSIVIRKQTHRWQNVIAAAALIVIIALVVMGKKQHDGSSRDAADAGASATAHATVIVTPVAAPAIRRTNGKAHQAAPATSSADAASAVSPAPEPSALPRDE
jgi:hypothetical protein